MGELVLARGAGLAYLGARVVDGDLHVIVGVFLCEEALEGFLNVEREYYAVVWRYAPQLLGPSWQWVNV